MSDTEPTPPRRRKGRTRRVAMFTTATIVSFSFTLLAAGIGLLTGIIPLRSLSAVQRVDIGALLFLMPVVALVLGVVFEATRIAMRTQGLPEPRRQQTVTWHPGNREG